MSVYDLLKQIEKWNKQIEEIQAQCPHNLQEKYHRGDNYETRCLECRYLIEGFMGYIKQEEAETFKIVRYNYDGCQDPEAHKMYHMMGAFCPCK